MARARRESRRLRTQRTLFGHPLPPHRLPSHFSRSPPHPLRPASDRPPLLASNCGPFTLACESGAQCFCAMARKLSLGYCFRGPIPRMIQHSCSMLCELAVGERIHLLSTQVVGAHPNDMEVKVLLESRRAHRVQSQAADRVAQSLYGCFAACGYFRSHLSRALRKCSTGCCVGWSMRFNNLEHAFQQPDARNRSRPHCSAHTLC